MCQLCHEIRKKYLCRMVEAACCEIIRDYRLNSNLYGKNRDSRLEKDGKTKIPLKRTLIICHIRLRGKKVKILFCKKCHDLVASCNKFTHLFRCQWFVCQECQIK